MAAFTKNMGLTHEDFFRLLPRALDGRHFARDGLSVTIEDKSGKILIKLGLQQQRKIAGLTIPHVDVTFSFDGWSAQNIQEFMRRFEQSFQRGGG